MWEADIRAPFTKQTNRTTPAPTAYFNSKKQDDIRKRLLNEQTHQVPFGTSEDRPFKKELPERAPGPGTYFSQTSTQVSTKAPEYADTEKLKIDQVGSNAERKLFWIQPKDGPAPGQYDASHGMAEATTDP